jgi:glycerol-3-phosphate dehydrogenase
VTDRTESLRELSDRVFDVLVIGGGITGAGIARDAALRGLSVALIDKSDFASGTSSRSSRLIHGGVRYIEHGHLRLVFEASAERRRLLKIASHLVRPLPFTWPVYDGHRLPVWKLAAGLTMYDALALFRNVERHRRLGASDVVTQEPALARLGLVGGVRYFDAATDDSRLTLANVLDARTHGAVVANHAVLTGITYGRESGGLRTAAVEDALTGDRFDVRAQIIVNATGPWSDSIQRMLDPGGPPPASKVMGSKGTHIAVPRERIRNLGAVVMLHPRDGRVMFALPADSHTIIGTTDTFTSASPDDVRASVTDVRYLLEAANAYFPDAELDGVDVVAAWAGIRPLMPTTQSSVAASREHLITRRPGGREVTITGGKLTTFRVMARQVVDVVQRMLGMPRTRPVTGDRKLPGDLPTPTGDAVVGGLPYRTGQIHWFVERELARTLGDILIRRTKIAFETKDNGRDAARAVADVVAPALGWDAVRRARELDRYEVEVTRIFDVDPY